MDSFLKDLFGIILLRYRNRLVNYLEGKNWYRDCKRGGDRDRERIETAALSLQSKHAYLKGLFADFTL